MISLAHNYTCNLQLSCCLCLWMKEDIHCQKCEEAFTIFKAYFKKWNSMRLRTWPIEDNRLKNKWPQVHLRMTSVWLCSKLLFEVRKEQIPFCLGTKLGACSLLSIYCGSVWWVSAWKNSPILKEWTNYFVKNSVKLYICTNHSTQFCTDVKGFHTLTTSTTAEYFQRHSKLCSVSVQGCGTELFLQ